MAEGDASEALVKIEIKGYNKPVVYSNLRIEQYIGNHHSFSFNWSATDFKADPTTQMNVVKNYLSKSVNVTFNAPPSKSEFKGIITAITVEEQDGTSQSFKISGYSPTVLLEDSRKCSSYYKKNLENIINTVIQGVSANDLSSDIDPSNSDELFYTVQYNETDFQFIRRLASRYGEWFYYDGEKMVFGKKGHDCDELESGLDLDNFRLTARIKGLNFSFSSYDPHSADSLSDNVSGSGSGNPYLQTASDTSGSIFSRQSDRPFHSPMAHNKRILDSVKDVQKKASVSNIIEFTGSSDNVSLKVGSDVTIITGDDNNQTSGKYFLVGVTHISNLPGHYSNLFTSIPSSVEAPPYTNPYAIVSCETQTAKVVDNEDQDKLGRIKVRFPWQKSSDTTPWLRITQPHGGDGKGFYFIPEKDEEVLVDFEDGNADKPIVIGTGYNGNQKPWSDGVSGSDNNFKVIRTRSGSHIFFGDENGSEMLLIANKDKKNQILLDYANNQIIVKSEGDIHIQAEQNIEIKAGQDINISAQGDIKVDAQGKIAASAMAKMSLSTNDQFDLSAMSNISIASSTGDAEITASAGNGNLSALNVKIDGEVQTSVQGAQVQVQGEAMAQIKGAMVMIN